MKKTIIPILSIAVLVGISSCAKSTKGKLSNDWKVTSFEEVNVAKYPSGTISESQLAGTASAYTISYANVVNGEVQPSQPETGIVKQHQFTIRKDGTWSLVKELESDVEYNTLDELSGTWSFLGKTKGDDFKKNERVLFNILQERKQIINGGQPIVSDYTYLSGDKVMVYTIKESKGKKLELESEAGNTLMYEGGGHTITTSVKMTLEK